MQRTKDSIANQRKLHRLRCMPFTFRVPSVGWKHTICSSLAKLFRFCPRGTPVHGPGQANGLPTCSTIRHRKLHPTLQTVFPKPDSLRATKRWIAHL